MFHSIQEIEWTDDAEMNELRRRKIEQELARIERNAERRQVREKAKGRPGGGSPSAASPGGQSDAAGSAEGTPQKGARGRNKGETARKCANCGQVGHIKTNRKSVQPLFDCLICGVMPWFEEPNY